RFVVSRGPARLGAHVLADARVLRALADGLRQPVAGRRARAGHHQRHEEGEAAHQNCTVCRQLLFAGHRNFGTPPLASITATFMWSSAKRTSRNDVYIEPPL